MATATAKKPVPRSEPADQAIVDGEPSVADENDEELRRLVAFLDLADGFDLAFAQCNREDDARGLIAEGAERCAALGIEVVTVDLAEAESLVQPLEEVERRLPQGPAPPGRRRVVMVTGFSRHVRTFDPKPKPFVSFNYERDDLPRRLPYPIVLWMSDYRLTTLSRVAPDLWGWGSARFGFRGAPDPGHEAGRTLLQVEAALEELVPVTAGTAASMPVGARLLHEPADSYRKADEWPACAAAALALARSHSSPDCADHRCEGLAWLESGVALVEQGNYAQALPALRRAVDTMPPAAAQCRSAAVHALGSVLLSTGDFAAAALCAEEGLTLDVERDDRAAEAQTRLLLGKALIRGARYREAARSLQRSAKLFARAADRHMHAHAVCEGALAVGACAGPRRGLWCIARARRLASAAGLPADHRLAGLQALLLCKMRRYDRAIRVLDGHIRQAADEQLPVLEMRVILLRGALGSLVNFGPVACAFMALALHAWRSAGESLCARFLRLALDRPWARAAIADAKAIARRALAQSASEAAARFIDWIDYDPAEVYAALAELDRETDAQLVSPAP